MTTFAFTVAGTGAFPFDMLRYDECWPATSVAANAVAMDVRDVRARDSRRAVPLLTNRRAGPTIRRWESFGWRVISHRENGMPLEGAELEAAIADASRARQS